MKSLLLAALLAAIWSTSSFADLLFEYDFTGEPGNQASTAATNVAAGLTADPISRGPGLNAATGPDSINASGWSQPTQDYYTFGFSIGNSIQSVVLEILNIQTEASGAPNFGPGVIGLYTSQDGFAALINDQVISQSPGGTGVARSFNLSSLAPVTSSIEFRLIQVGTEDASGTGELTKQAGTLAVTNVTAGLNPDPVTLTGTITPVPEPSSIALLGFVGGACLICRRFRQRRRLSL